MATTNRFEDRAHVAAVVTGRDGVIGAVGDGIGSGQMPDGDGALWDAWMALEEAYAAAAAAADAVRNLLEESA